MNLTLELRIYVNRKHLNKNNKEVTNSCYFLKIEELNKVIAIKPLSTEDYALLNLVATKKFDESLPKENKDKTKDNSLIDQNGKAK